MCRRHPIIVWVVEKKIIDEIWVFYPNRVHHRRIKIQFVSVFCVNVRIFASDS